MLIVAQKPWRWLMLTILLFAAAISGSGDTKGTSLSGEVPVLRAALLAPKGLASRVRHLERRFASRGLGEEEIRALLDDARLERRQRSESSVTKPIGWRELLLQMLSDDFVARGKQYIADNANALVTVRDKYGPDEAAQTALVALESRFGDNTGKHIAWNVFYEFLFSNRMMSKTLWRWEWAAENLVALAVYCTTHDADCYSIKSSYMGAVGRVQFLPSNLLAFGEDADGDGKVDLDQAFDAHMSAGNLLRANEWGSDLKSMRDALSRYYCGLPYTHPKALRRGGRAYADVVLIYAQALREPAEGLQAIRKKAEERFPLPKKKSRTQRAVPSVIAGAAVPVP